ncbi:MAG TPA: hypothetical protein PLQ49_05820 [Methanothrix sp.]|nr:hypothetical protein [Methanothrix sp.]HRW81897.1 hypothetical protein [Methanothrix sp.]
MRKWCASPESFRGGLRASISAGAELNRQSGQPSGSRLDGGGLRPSTRSLKEAGSGPAPLQTNGPSS